MAYIGLQPQQKTVATSTQTLSGNGVDLEFALSRAVSKSADILVFVGTTVQVPELHYTAYDNTLLFAGDNIPASGTNNISVNYKAGALSTVYLDANAFPVGSTTTPSIYSVDAASTGIYFPSTTSVGIAVSGNTRVAVSDSSTATSTTTGALRVTGGAGVTGALYVGGATRLTATTQSTNSTTGALVISGGLGVAKNTFIGGTLEVAGDFTVAGQFTTTAQDSLTVNDPFIFLANTNAGDNLDTGTVSTYNDGVDQRYTGFFRDITDGKYKIFDNLLVQPGTTVDTGNVSFRYADLYLGNANITSTASSTTSTTGALRVAGGVGVQGAIAVNSLNNVTALINGGTSGVGNIGASGAVFNYGYFNSLVGTLTTAAQPNITSTGTLTSLTVTGNVAAGNVSGTYLTGTLTTASQTTITGVGTLTTGALGTGFTTVATTQGGTGLTSFTSGGAVYASSTSALTTGTLPVSAGGTGITSFGTGVATFLGTPSSANLLAAVTDETGTGALVFGTSPTFTTQITTPVIVHSGTNAVGDIGASGNGFGTVWAKATSAQYADVAEKYLADAAYEPGTVLHFGGVLEVSQCNEDMCNKIAGVVSTNPAYIMNNELNGEFVVDVALLGRVPCKVQGAIAKGDMLVSAGNGRARAEAEPKLGSVIGKALENFSGAEGVIEVVVGRV